MKKMIQKLLKHKIVIACFVIMILSILSIVIQEIDRKNNLQVNNVNLQKVEGKVAVYITGGIKNEGVYYLNEGARIKDAIDIAGGIIQNADINQLNLAMKVIDGDKIIVPVKQEIVTVESEDENEINDKVNINTASQEELETLTGIGENTAKKIIQYREKNSFIEIQDIMKVEGIGQSKFNKIKDDICTD